MPYDYLWPKLADDLLKLLDQAAPGQAVHAAGPSMGSATLLYAALRDPERFRTLTLMVPPTAWETREHQGESYRASADLVEKQGSAPSSASARTCFLHRLWRTARRSGCPR
ncbi:alpha/beta hydrolase [Nesterenkonia pannonica]|uniref:alpha/beta hydrolase n=1 Tax=Nesterenkonia pannonica TaxID=1548602 RepID=UPI002164201C|nr:alpha/beta hydrolase [Nesterenkonia pannonica]